MTVTAAAPNAGVAIVELDAPDTERSPVQLLSLAVALFVFVVALLIAVADKDALLGFENDLLHFVNQLPDLFQRFLLGLSQFVAVIYPVVIVAAFVALRRPVGLLVAALGGVLGGGAVWLLEDLIDRPRPAALLAEQRTTSWIIGAGFPNFVYVAVASALAVVAGAYFGHRWRRTAWVFVGAVVLFRIVAGVDVPADLAMAIALGWAAGDVALLVFGAPTHRSSGRAIAHALDRSGLRVERLAPASVDARGSTPWFATTTAGQGLFVKVLGRDERDADLLFRIYRYLRLKNVGDQRPFSTLRRSVEHEALIALKARDSGVRTPHLRTVATVEPDALLLAYEMVDGRSLDRVTDPCSDTLLHGIWEQVAILRRERIAHRDLRRANIFVDDRGRPWIIDFGFSELAATDDMLNQDVAELLASTACIVGPERAVDAAIDGIGAEGVGAALPYLQMPAFPGATREALHEQKGLLDALRKTVIERTSTPEVRYEPINRVSPRTALMLVSSLIAIYILIPQLSDVEGMVRQLKDANWFFVGTVLVLSLVTYLGAALSLVAVSPVPVQYANAAEVSLAGSFVNRITPAGIGGIGLNIRFMQKAGADTAEAASRWGVNTVVGGIVHFSLMAMFLLWAGQENAFHFRLPKMPLLVALAVVTVGSGIVFLVPYGRRKLLGPLRKVIRHAWEGVVDVAHEPARLGLMFAAGAMITLGYLFGLYAAVRAFDGHTALSAVGAVYLAGSAIGSAAPTPGGIGAVEAILIAGLVSVGLDKEIAVPAVLLFRLATFWLPILPGWLSFSSLSRREEI
jgi:glycosyltransferase 2 family protein